MVFVFDKSFQPSLVFVGKAGVYPRVEKIKTYFILGRLLAFPTKHWSMLEKPVRDSHFSLLHKVAIYIFNDINKLECSSQNTLFTHEHKTRSKANQLWNF